METRPKPYMPYKKIEPLKKPNFFAEFWILTTSFFIMPSIKTLYFYTVGLYSTISAGMPIASAFEIMSESTTHRRLKKASLKIRQEIDSGIPVDKIFTTKEYVFPKFYINMLLAGIRFGAISKHLKMLIDHYAFILKMRSVIFSVLWYPMFQLIAGAMILTAKDTIIMTMQGPFNLIKAIIYFYNYFSAFLYGIVTAFLFSRMLKARQLRPITDELIAMIPFIGQFYRKYKLAIFFKVYATMIDAGAGASFGLKTAIEAMDNYRLARMLKNAERFLKDGESVFESFKITNAFTPSELSMIQVGEDSGGLSFLLEKMSGYYENDVKAIMPGAIKTTIPLLTIIVAFAFFYNVSFFGVGSFFMLSMFFMIF